MYTVYAIRSLTTGRIYIGQTKNFEDRLRDHNAGHVQSTKKDKTWELCALQNMENRKEVMHMEWKLKCSKGARLRWLEKQTISNATPSSNEKGHLPKGLSEAYPRGVYDS